MNLTMNSTVYRHRENLPEVLVLKTQKEKISHFSIRNDGMDTCVDEVILCDIPNPFSAETKVYGEGYSMLSQYIGTVAQMKCIETYDDTVHYRLPKKEGFQVVFNLAIFEENDRFTLIGFSSCHRYCGQIRFNLERLEIALNFEGKKLLHGQTIPLEDLYISTSKDREQLLADFAKEVSRNHPRLEFSPVPDGWCSWYCFGPNVTEQNILENLDRIQELSLSLHFIQVDDGYEKYMGDWLTPADTFPNGIKPLFEKILAKGFEPAIWVAPFIAEKDSEVLRKHPDWFIQDEAGHPLSSAEFTFGGWRCGPWYMLDPTNPAAYEHLRSVFSYMRNEWKCRYFKLDANMWGAFPNGVRFDQNATAAESYRLGMKAILEGAGEDSFLLGCNAPMWPSIGTIHGNRITGDVYRRYENFKEIALEGFYRNWQNGNFWINDPDCATLEKLFAPVMDMGGRIRYQQADLTDDEFLFHATYLYATGGMVLSGDDLSQPSPERLKILRFLLDGPHIAAKFDDTTFRIGRITLENKQMLCLFNWSESPQELEIHLHKSSWKLKDIWLGSETEHPGEILKYIMPPHSGRLLECSVEKDK